MFRCPGVICVPGVHAPFFPPYVRILAHRRPTCEAFIPIHVRVLPDVGKLQVAMPGHPDHEERDRQQPEPHLVRQVGGIVLPSQLGIQDLYVEDSICLKSLSYAQTKALVYMRPPKLTYRYHDNIMILFIYQFLMSYKQILKNTFFGSF